MSIHNHLLKMPKAHKTRDWVGDNLFRKHQMPVGNDFDLALEIKFECQQNDLCKDAPCHHLNPQHCLLQRGI